MTPLDPNDPRFTAKALGEEETQDINPEANEEFASLQDFAQTLKSELKARDEQDALTAEQKERVRVAIQPKEKKLLKFPVWLNALAACLVLGLVGIIALKNVDPILSSGQEDMERLMAEQSALQSRNEVILNETPSKSSETDGNIFLHKSSPEEGSRIAEEIASLDSNQSPQNSTKPETPRLKISSEDGIYELSPFEIQESESSGYAASSTLAGTRITTELRGVGGTIEIARDEFMEDTGAGDTPILFGLGAKSAPADTRANFTEPKRASAEVASNRDLIKDQIAVPVPSAVSIPVKPTKQEPWSREAYDRIVENAFKNPKDHPLSTFSIDVDTASYANVRRYLNNNQLPPPDAVRIEEMINYFSYDYTGPADETPFAVHVDSATTPWNENHRLVRIGLQGDKVDLSERPDANLVFLIDVSGSMSDQNKLPLVQRSLNLLVDQMEARDRIAVVVYAGASGLALPSTTANNKETIQHAISNLSSGGSTNGGAGIELAYATAQKHFVKDGINRVILCTDGDFNVGTTDRGSLTRMIEEKAKSGVFFSVLGFGMGNYQDAAMEELSNKGNGNYGYVDSFKEARKVFVDDMLGTLYTIAKDVKIQVEFNPAYVGSYRLIGYENRMLAKEDFNDDKKDAGEIGAGHRVTALYEIVPVDLKESSPPTVDPLKYQAATKPVAKSTELLTVKLRYKQPDADASQLIERPFIDPGSELANASDDFRFATAVASFGMLLRHSEHSGSMTLNDVLTLANKAKGNDTGGLRSEFIELVEKAIQLTPKKEVVPANPEPNR
jgi:Ca-activated chloride channel homolog